MSPLLQYVNYFPKAVATKGTPAYFGTRQILGNILVRMHPKHQDCIFKLRSMNKNIQREFKNSQIPCFTVSGYFEKDGSGSRNSEDLVYRTGAVCLDLDVKADYSSDLKSLKRQIVSEPYVAFACDSCRGQGIFIIIHVAEPEHHERYFDFLGSWLDMNGCLSAFDKSTKNINRLRFVSHDENYFINYRTIPLELPKIQQHSVTENFMPRQNLRCQINNSIETKIDFAVKILQKQGHVFVDGYKHVYLYHLCCVLNKLGVSQEQAEAYINTLIPLQAVKSNCIVYAYKAYKNKFNSWSTGI